MKERAEREAAEREKREKKQSKTIQQNKAAYNTMKQTPPTSPSLPAVSEDDLEELLEEVT